MSDFEKLITANGMLWTLCKLRKPATCAATGKSMQIGDEAYRPITNGADRMKRIKPMLIHRAKTPSPQTNMQIVWDEIGTALALLDESEASPKARTLIRTALESATGCKAPHYFGGSTTPLNDGPAYLDFITPDEVFDKGPEAVLAWQETKHADISKQEKASCDGNLHSCGSASDVHVAQPFSMSSTPSPVERAVATTEGSDNG